ncbi:hypothetical protein [Glacieibacterium frigidum]|uniref:Uncharacterized protein n=1 Tax=Glacieibacterium frigidum TaxID=2593303 RepID=A0A552UGK9_9SPHN|nr:hypothetical protein [Glacieibacterium frigidum]TRW17354.1 hypothetical protein FMM06_04045 [Glacieibacterium frigidum]
MTAPRLGFRSTAASAKAAQGAFVARLGKSNPAAAKTLAVQLAKHDTTLIMRTLLSGSGLQPDDLGDVFTAYTLFSWQIANRDATDIGNATVAALRNQLTARLSADPRLLQPAMRTALGEEMKLLSVTIHAGWQSATREGRTKAYSDSIAAMFKARSGTDLRALRLTSAGFRPR